MSTEPAQTLQSMLPKDLTTLQDLLLRGSKSEAVRFALDRHMFAHAILISRGLDIETQTEVIKEFCALALTTSSSESFEPLKVLYRSLSGSGTASRKYCGTWIYTILTLSACSARASSASIARGSGTRGKPA